VSVVVGRRDRRAEAVAGVVETAQRIAAVARV
jgi:hypothetical protein